MIDLTYTPDGIIPVIAQDNTTREVLMLAWANAEALELTLKTGYAHYYSRSRGKIWKKGEESGHVQKIHEIRTDCDADTLLYLVTQQTAACHTGYMSCFYRTIEGKIIGDRVFEPKEAYNKKE